MPVRLWTLLLFGVCLSDTPCAAPDAPRRKFDAYRESQAHPVPPPKRPEPRAFECEVPKCPSLDYEPLFSLGDYFLARASSQPHVVRSSIRPYTKNATLLVCALFAFCCGVLLGAAVTVKVLKRHPGVDRATSTEDAPADDDVLDDRLPVPLTPVRGAVNEMGALNLEDPDTETEAPPAVDPDVNADAACQLAAVQNRPLPEDSPRGERALMENGRLLNGELSETEMLCDCIRQLNRTIKETNQPLNIIARVTKRISASLISLTHLTRWLAWRKAKKDLWMQARDNMSHGILVMNVALGISACLFGRWQDWGLQCGIRPFSWSVHSLLGMMWCWIEEPFIFLLGCLFWWITMRCACSSEFLKRKHPLSIPLLLLTFSCAGMAQSFVVSLLGGSWTISFTLWIIYSLFLVQMLDSASPVLTEGHLKSSNHGFVVSHGGWNACLSVFVFPILAGTLPFWHTGLALLLFSQVELCAISLGQHFSDLYTMSREFLLY